jgi:hypothetical protein
LFDSALHDGMLMRFHEAADRRLTFKDDESVAVAVTAAEYAEQSDGPVGDGPAGHRRVGLVARPRE